MLIEELSSENGADWDDYVARNSRSTCYHLREWRDVARHAYRIHAPFLLTRDERGGPCRGVLPLFAVHGMIGSHLANGLFGAYGAILSDHDRARRALIDHAVNLFENGRFSLMMFKNLEDPDMRALPGFERTDHWVIATLGLDPDPGRIWMRLKDKTRNCVRKSLRFGMEARTGNENLRGFYDALSENMHSKGAPVYGYEFMREIVQSLGERSEVITLWRGDRVVSGALLLYHRKTVYIPFASSRPGALAMCPNNLLYWEIIRRSCLKGMEKIDFGRSMRDSGSLKFKLSWGATVEAQPSFVRSQKEKPLNIDPKKNAAVCFFVRQWQRLPRPVANALGPSVCRKMAGLL